jgi:YHS domain-containing protein/putative intracellular protease/amidase
MQRRELLKKSAALGFVGAMPLALSYCGGRRLEAATSANGGGGSEGPEAPPNPLKRPADGSAIPVAFLMSEHAVMIDFAGPWEVFTNVMPGGRMDMATFRLYTVAETLDPVRASGGMKIVPDYTLETAPTPKVIVIPAQTNSRKAVLEWIRRSSKTADLTMSVCTGAFLLAETGLLAGRAATTHHGAYDELAMKYPDIRVKRGLRFVEDGNLATSGGLSCGIDLALRVVERYYGRDVARQAAYNMEYEGQGWIHPASNAVYANARSSATNHPICPVCSMEIDVTTALSSFYKGKTYYFCSPDHKALFATAPDRFVARVNEPVA